MEEQFWCSDHFSQKAKDDSISYDALTDAKKAIKETSLSFFDLEIHCWYIVKVKYADERKKLLVSSLSYLYL